MNVKSAHHFAVNCTDFERSRTFYEALKARGFVIYPGKVTGIESFRIGTIGHAFPEDFHRLISAVGECASWRG